MQSHRQISAMEGGRMAYRRVGLAAHTKGRAQRSAQQKLPRHGSQVVHRPLTTMWGVLKKERADVRFPPSLSQASHENLKYTAMQAALGQAAIVYDHVPWPQPHENGAVSS